MTPCVSIHAPAGDATSDRASRDTREIVSIHAPAGDATYLKVSRVCSLAFQSTRLRETRPMIVLVVGKTSTVSIHAPAGDATGQDY